MLKFFPKKEAVRDEVFEEVQNFATAAAAKQMKQARRKRGETPWASWPPQKKQALAEELASGLSWSAFKVLCVSVFLHLVGAFSCAAAARGRRDAARVHTAWLAGKS